MREQSRECGSRPKICLTSAIAPATANPLLSAELRDLADRDDSRYPFAHPLTFRQRANNTPLLSKKSTKKVNTPSSIPRENTLPVHFNIAVTTGHSEKGLRGTRRNLSHVRRRIRSQCTRPLGARLSGLLGCPCPFSPIYFSEPAKHILHFVWFGVCFVYLAYQQPVKYNLAVARDVLKHVYTAERLQPPTSPGAVFGTYGTLWGHARSLGNWREVVWSGEYYARVGVYALEAYGVFKVRFVFFMPF